jgi:hypothetical protein
LVAASVMTTFHDTTPDTPASLAREAEMRKLISLLQATVDDDDQTTVPAIIDNVIVETKFTPQAAERLKTLLPKLGKSAYDID